jgi:nucleoid-associated protein YgaU
VSGSAIGVEQIAAHQKMQYASGQYDDFRSRSAPDRGRIAKLTFQHALSLPVQSAHVVCDVHWSARLTDGIPGLVDLMTITNQRRVNPGMLTSQRSGQGSRIMTAKSMGRIVVPSMALVAACGAVLVVGITHVRREPPFETRAATAPPAVSPPASGRDDKGSAALATAQAEASAVAAALDASPRSPETDESAPVFDIARIERTGDAVIAGRAAPGAIVELLRNGERHDRTVADQSGQFVMVPPRLPPGDYELTLRSRQPDGKQATSKQSVVVALADVESNPGAVRSRAEVPFNVPETVGVNAHQSSQPPSQIANRQDIAVSQLPHATVATALSDEGSSSAVVVPKIATTVVSRGDSLWRISRVTYGAGTRYAVVYKANQGQIRNPNRIYPGQIFVLPLKAR